MRTRCAVATFCASLSYLMGIPSANAVDEIYGDGFDGPKWFIDADGDGYGNPAVFVHADTQPVGYVANALDCNDADATIHPGAPDDPDAAFIDSNCDGIDGDIAKAIFVATTGVDINTCGTIDAPCQTPTYAVGRLDPQHTQIYLQVGIYSGPLTLTANASFYGGYDAQWIRGPVTAGGPNAALQGANATMGTYGTQAFAVYMDGGVSALFADVEIDAPSTNAKANGNGLDSYALYADTGTSLHLVRDRIVQGAGAIGSNGTDGVDAAQTVISTPTKGGDAAQYSSICDTTSHGSGAAPSSNFCSSGRSTTAGHGGDGGVMDDNCTDENASAGAAGTNAIYTSGAAGIGGSGGPGTTVCSAPHDGAGGALTDGAAGTAGSGSSVIGGLWIANGGGSGGLGENGGGGGGGGGSGGCDTGTDSYGAGGGGGGAGGCAATTAGTGGGGGGASFGVFASAALINATGNTFVLGNGGSGGNGGKAGVGQPGGNGGIGGFAAGNSKAGGHGGNGARGGVAAGGGGGQGGGVYGIYSNSAAIVQSGNTFTGGVAGSGGAGGTSSVGQGAGQKGTDGLLVGSCANPPTCN